MANTLEIGKLRAVLGLDTAQYEAGARKAQTTNAQLAAGMKSLEGQITKLHGPADQLRTRFLGMHVAFGAFAGSMAGDLIGAGVRALTRLGREAVETAGNLVDMSGRTGISIEALQRMDYVAGQTGSTLEEFTRAAFQLGVRLNGGSKSVAGAVKELGLELQSLRQMRPEDQFAAVLDAMGQIDDAGRRNEIGMRLFGRSVAAVLPAAADGYKKLAAEARAAGDAQVMAIDKAADAWAALLKTITTGAVQFGGSFALGIEALQKMTALQRMQLFLLAGAQNPLETIIKLGEARAGVLAEQANAQKKLDDATKASVVTDVDYARQLAAVRKELAALTPEQRKQIESAQALGVSTDDLEAKYGLSSGALRVLTDQTRDNTRETEKNTEAKAKQAAEYREFNNFIAQREIENVELQQKAITDTVRAASDGVNDRLDLLSEYYDSAEEKESQYRDFLNELGQQELEDYERHLNDKDKLDREYRDLQNRIGEQEIEAIERAQREALERADRTVEMFTRSVSNGFADMLVGARGFKDGFLDIWRGIQYSIASILSDILNDFLKRFLGGLIRGITNAKIGERLGQSLAGGSMAGGIPGLTGGGAGGTGGVITAGQLGQGLLQFGGGALAGGAVGWGVGSKTGNTAAGILSGAASGAGVGWMFGGPIGAGIGAIVGGLAGFFGARSAQRDASKVRDRFLIGNWGGDRESAGPRAAAWLTKATGLPNGSPLYADLLKAKTVDGVREVEAAIAAIAAPMGKRIRMFNNGGFVPPGAVQPAILHGGTRGEIVLPLDKMNSGLSTSVVNHHHWHIQTFDAPSMTKIVETQVIPVLNTAANRNVGQYATEHRKGFGIRPPYGAR